MKRFLTLALILIVSSAVPALSQGTNAAISGTVLDPMNAVIAGAQVTAVNIRTGVKTMPRATNPEFTPFRPFNPDSIQ